jgi:hypothetical protein
MFLAVASVAAFAALTATANGAPNQTALASVLCAPGSQWSLNTVTGANGFARATGDQPREPSLNQVVEDLPADAKGKGGPSFRATVPVYFHVVSAGSVGDISQTIIDDQMKVLNLAYAGFYGGVNTGFKFKLAAVTRTDNAAWHFAGPGSPDERAMKKALHQGGWDALNLYSTTAGAYLGWAYLPGLSESRQYLDGIVVDWESMPGASTRYAGRYDLGQTATHEAGHWLDLEHVFYGGCNDKGDFVDDTPPQLTATRGCPEGQDSCKEPGLDSIHNYMDYSDDSCYDQFTAGQRARLQDAWLFFRAAG